MVGQAFAADRAHSRFHHFFHNRRLGVKLLVHPSIGLVDIDAELAGRQFQVWQSFCKELVALANRKAPASSIATFVRYVVCRAGCCHRFDVFLHDFGLMFFL